MTGTKETSPYDVIAGIAAAYAARPDVNADDILDLVARLAGQFGLSLAGPGRDEGTGPGIGLTEQPALPIDQAVRSDKVFCLCCGKGFKMLKRHLGAEHGLSEQSYRALFRLPADFPLVAPDYSERKAAYARKAGLGRYARHDGTAGSDGRG